MIIVSVPIKASMWLDLITFTRYYTFLKNHRDEKGKVVMKLYIRLGNNFYIVLPEAAGGLLLTLGCSGSADAGRWEAGIMAGKGL